MASLDKSMRPALYSLLGSGTNPLKMSREDACYQDSPGPGGEQTCLNCSSSYTQNVSGEVVCSQVEGLVKRSGWCRLWNTDRY